MRAIGARAHPALPGPRIVGEAVTGGEDAGPAESESRSLRNGVRRGGWVECEGVSGLGETVSLQNL